MAYLLYLLGLGQNFPICAPSGVPHTHTLVPRLASTWHFSFAPRHFFTRTLQVHSRARAHDQRASVSAGALRG